MDLTSLFAIGTLRRAGARTLCLAGIAAGILLATGARADPPPGAASPVATAAWAGTPLQHATPAELQSTYLACDRMAMSGLLDFGTATYCSVVYEALKARVFGGDFDRLLTWHRQAGTPAPAQATAVSGP